jgi:hypothetical protein
MVVHSSQYSLLIPVKMKYIASIRLLTGFVLVITLSSCCKNTDEPDPVAGCVAGNDGAIQVKLTAVHHNDTIPSLPNYPDSAFIKFNTSEFPGDNPALYDLVIAGSFPDTLIIADSLSCGNYFIFMTGWDVSIAERVVGGIPITLFQGDTVKNIRIPVTEGD